MFTSLYLTKVLPASRPPAAVKMMVMVGPSFMMRWTAMPTATTAARIRMIQTTEMRVRLFGTTVATGTFERSESSAMSPLFLVRIPYQAGVERLRRQHRQHHHRRKEQHARAGLHRHQRLQLNQ